MGQGAIFCPTQARKKGCGLAAGPSLHDCTMSKISAFDRAHIRTITCFAGNANYFVEYFWTRSRGRKEPVRGPHRGPGRCPAVEGQAMNRGYPRIRLLTSAATGNGGGAASLSGNLLRSEMRPVQPGLLKLDQARLRSDFSRWFMRIELAIRCWKFRKCRELATGDGC
jgi:hypothetical protein